MAITPNAVDTYSRMMDDLFDEKEIINVSTVWQAFFGKPGNGGSKTVYSPNSEVIDIDIMRGNERTAALIHRGTDSRHIGNLQRNTTTQNFSTFSRVFPFAEELGDISASQINKRMAGENPYESRASVDRFLTSEFSVNIRGSVVLSILPCTAMLYLQSYHRLHSFQLVFIIKTVPDYAIF